MSRSSQRRRATAAPPREGRTPGGSPERGRLSIGALSRATGVPVETLRTWEQRYGFPAPERTASGHRLYPAAVVDRLRRITSALAQGHRASETVGATDEELRRLLAATAPAGRPPVGTLLRASGEGQDDLLRAVATYDGDTLRRSLLAAWAILGPLGFLEHRVAPLIRAVGEHWASGRLEIRHEHFVSEKIGDLLRLLRAPFDERAGGPLVILTTLPGEGHSLGLQMAGLLMASLGLRVVLAGSPTPVPEIAALAADVGARAVALSVSSATRGPATRRALAALRQRLPVRVRVIVGGAGAPSSLDGIDVVDSLDDLQVWTQALLEPTADGATDRRN